VLVTHAAHVCSSARDRTQKVHIIRLANTVSCYPNASHRYTHHIQPYTAINRQQGCQHRCNKRTQRSEQAATGMRDKQCNWSQWVYSMSHATPPKSGFSLPPCRCQGWIGFWLAASALIPVVQVCVKATLAPSPAVAQPHRRWGDRGANDTMQNRKEGGAGPPHAHLEVSGPESSPS
jgi:hypothetical protein